VGGAGSDRLALQPLPKLHPATDIQADRHRVIMVNLPQSAIEPTI
jgi:hypothetical protein